MNQTKIEEQLNKQTEILDKLTQNMTDFFSRMTGVMPNNELNCNVQNKGAVALCTRTLTTSKKRYEFKAKNTSKKECEMPYLVNGKLYPEGTIRQRLDNNRWGIRYYDNGKIKSISRRNQVECLELFRNALTERDNRQKFDAQVIRVKPTVSKGIALFEWLDEWYEKYKKNTSWGKNIKGIIKNHIKPNFPNLLITDYTALDIEAGLEKIQYSKSKKDACDILSGAFKEALKGTKHTNVMQLVTKPKHIKEHGNAFTKDMQNVFLQYAKQNSKYYDYYLTYFNTGCRTGEIYEIRKSDINFEQKTIYINGTKTGEKSKRTVPIFAPLIPMLIERINKTKGEFLFTASVKAIREDFKNILRAIGLDLKDYTVYSMRHSYATRLYESGVDLKTISAWMAHTNITTTIKYYIHLLSEHEKNQALIFEEKLAIKVNTNDRGATSPTAV